MAFLASFLKHWRMMVLVAALATAGVAYFLYRDNQDLREDLSATKDELDDLKLTRKKDALAAKQLIEAMETERMRLEAQLESLAEVTDEEGRDYLRTPIPDSVRRVLNP